MTVGRETLIRYGFTFAETIAYSIGTYKTCKGLRPEIVCYLGLKEDCWRFFIAADKDLLFFEDYVVKYRDLDRFAKSLQQLLIRIDGPW